MKIFIAGGAGTMGSCIARALADGAPGDEIVLYDANHGHALNHAMDLLESVCLTSAADVRAGALTDMQSSDIIVNVMSVGGGADHMKSLEQTASEMLKLFGHVERLAPDAVVITASNPVDVYNGLLCRRAGLPAERWLGYSYNDTIRFRRTLGRVLKLPAARINACMIGEHGATKVPVFSSVEIDGKPFIPDPEQKAAVLSEMTEWWDVYTTQTGNLRTAGWTSAFGVAEMVKRISGIESSPMPCSCMLDGQYGLTGLSLGVPVRLDRGGAAEIIELELCPDEKEAFETSAAKIRALTEDVLSRYA